QNLAQAAFNERFTSAKEALESYKAATTASPDAPQTWGALVGYYLRIGNYKEASKAADQGLKNVANDPDLKALRQIARQAKSVADVNAYRPLIQSLSHNPLSQPADKAWAIVWQAAQKDDSSADSVLKQLEALAEQYPRSLSLHSV